MLNYTDLGSGVPIVFIHGLGSRKEAWKPQYELSNQHRLIIPDLRGHGETELNDDISIKNFALDIIHLLEHLDISEAYICGLSLGGIVAQELYKQRKDLVKGLILANTTSYIPPLFAYSIIEESYRLHNESDEELIEHILDRGFYDSSHKKEAKDSFLIRDTYMESAMSGIGLNYFAYLPFISAPVLLIGSSHDKVTPAFNVPMMEMFIYNATSVILDKTGHLSNIEQKDKFNSLVESFIENNK
ncbi:alpha/beta fold hydrolase [Priestia endophytica]